MVGKKLHAVAGLFPCLPRISCIVLLTSADFWARSLFGRRRPLRLMSCTPLACSLPPHRVMAAPSSWCLKAPPSQSRTLDTGGEWVVWRVTLTRQVFACGELTNQAGSRTGWSGLTSWSSTACTRSMTRLRPFDVAWEPLCQCSSCHCSRGKSCSCRSVAVVISMSTF